MVGRPVFDSSQPVSLPASLRRDTWFFDAQIGGFRVP